jgi:serine/threonine-protein kinase
MNAILESDIPPISALRPEVPAELAAVVHKGLSRDPADRFATARDMAVALDRAVPPASAREVGDWVGATATQILEERARRVADMEASSSETSKIVGGVVADVPEKKAADGETQTTDASLVSDSVTPRRRPAAWIVIALAAAGIGGAAAVFAGIHRAEPSEGSAPSSPALEDSALAPALPPPSSTPASSAPEPAASGSASVPVAPSSEAGGSPRRPAHPPAASPAHRRIDCDTPYEIDASGKRHWKKGC